MKRSALTADPEKVRAWQRKRKRVNPVNAARKAKRRAEGLVYGPYHRWISRFPCDLCGDTLAIGHHIKTVKAGGEDRGNEVPLCYYCHRAVHAGAKRWETDCGRRQMEAPPDLKALLRTRATEYERQWRTR